MSRQVEAIQTIKRRRLELDSLDKTAVEPLYHPLAYRGAVTYMVGDAGIGKTTFLYRWCYEVCQGNTFLDIEPLHQLSVWMLDFESSDNLLGRMLGLIGVKEFPCTFSYSNQEGMMLPKMVRDGEIARHYEEDPFDVLIIDNLGMAFSLEDENSNAEAQKCSKILKQIARGFDCAVILLHHPSKSTEVTGTRKGSGAYSWARYCSVHINVNEANKDDAILEFEIAKHRESEDHKSFFCQKMGSAYFEVCSAPTTYKASSERSAKDYPIYRAMDYISGLDKGSTFKRAALVALVRGKIHVKDRLVDEALRRLLAEGRISQPTYGVYRV